MKFLLLTSSNVQGFWKKTRRKQSETKYKKCKKKEKENGNYVVPFGKFHTYINQIMWIYFIVSRIFQIAHMRYCDEEEHIHTHGSLHANVKQKIYEEKNWEKRAFFFSFISVIFHNIEQLEIKHDICKFRLKIVLLENWVEKRKENMKIMLIKFTAVTF